MINYLYRPCSYKQNEYSLTLAQCKHGDDRNSLTHSVICMVCQVRQKAHSVDFNLTERVQANFARVYGIYFI